MSLSPTTVFVTSVKVQFYYIIKRKSFMSEDVSDYWLCKSDALFIGRAGE